MKVLTAMRAFFFSMLVAAIVIVSLAIVASARTKTEPSPYKFAFFNGNKIWFIDPTTPENTATFIDVPSQYPNREPLIVKSPDGKWIAIARPYVEMPENSIQIFDLMAGKLLPLIRVGNGLRGERGEYSNTSEDVMWSPDSQYLALSMFGPQHADIYLYSVRTQTVTDLTANDPGWHYGIAWTSTSDQLVTQNESCATDTNCTGHLTLQEFNLIGQVTRSVDVTNLYVGYGGFNLCHLQVSPNGMYVSFENICSFGIVITQEIYLWDVVTDTVKQITNFTKPLLTFPTAVGPTARYNTLWLGNNQLMISVAAFPPGIQTPKTTKTILYQPITNNEITLSDSYMDQWAVNSVTNQFAYNEVQAANIGITTTPSSATRDIRIAFLNTSSDYVLQNQKSPLVSSIGAGCDLAWSPDGHYLAYGDITGFLFASYNYSHCLSDNAIAVDFVDTTSGNLYRYAFPDDSLMYDYSIIGWVVAPGQSNPAATTSPTEIGSPATPGSGSVPGGNQIGG